jgi:hypothetical protein
MRFFSIGCYESIPKIIISIDRPNTTDINNYTTLYRFKQLLVSVCLISTVQILKIFEFAIKYVQFSNSEHIHFTNSICNNITRVKNHIHNVHQFNNQIVYSQQYSQRRSSIFTLFLSTSIEFTVQISNLSYKHS